MLKWLIIQKVEKDFLGLVDLAFGQIFWLKCDILHQNCRNAVTPRLRKVFLFTRKGGYKKTFDLLTILIKSHPMFCHAHEGLSPEKRKTPKNRWLLASGEIKPFNPHFGTEIASICWDIMWPENTVVENHLIYHFLVMELIDFCVRTEFYWQ